MANHTADRLPQAVVVTEAKTHASESQSSSVENVRRKRASVSRQRPVINFESDSIATTEKAIAAVFVLNRSEQLNGRVPVQWTSRSGSADATIDFSDTSGTAVFADRQTRVAVYVLLRNDLLKEHTETFQVCLQSAPAKLEPPTCAEASILDDD